MSSEATPVLVEKTPSPQGGHVVTLTLNRPEAMNSFSRSLIDAFEKAVDDVRRDPQARVLVMTGNGKAFSAGADLKERAGMPPEEVREFLYRVGRLFRVVENLEIPTIAAVNGYALGGGLELALCFDLRLAAADARMGLTETSLGIIPGAGGTQRLTRIVGLARARELIFTARRIDAKTAESMNLVNQVTDGHPHAAALETAQEIASNAPIALRQAKFAIGRGFDTDLETGLELERRAYELTIPTKDRLEALQAFKEKRKPVFKGE